MNKKLFKAAYVYAGAGDDRVQGGGGHQVLVGGPGSDSLKGGPLADVLVGGADADALYGGKGKLPPGDRDLLISGASVYDAQDHALNAIFADWSTEPDYLVAVDALRAGAGVPAVDGASVLEDDAVDSLTGGVDLDWFVIGSGDKIKDRGQGELVDVNGVAQQSSAATARLSEKAALSVQELSPITRRKRR